MLMGSSIDWHKQLRKLEKYANNKGYQVSFGKEEEGISWVCTESKTIGIHNGSITEYQVYDLLHELGHIEQQASGTLYNEYFHKVFEGFSRNSLTFKTKIVEEEIDAWNYGFILAKNLGIKIDRRRFEVQKAKAVSSYMLWAVK